MTCSQSSSVAWSDSRSPAQGVNTQVVGVAEEVHRPGYDGHVLRAHQPVHDLKPLRLDHFDRWYGLFERCVDDRWQGTHADLAKGHAARVARTLAHRILGLGWPVVDPWP